MISYDAQMKEDILTPVSSETVQSRSIHHDVLEMSQFAEATFGNSSKKNFTDSTLRYIDELVRAGAPTRETMRKEYIDNAEKYTNSAIGLMGAVNAMGAGVAGANLLVDKYSTELAERSALSSLIETNPKEYILAKSAQNQGRFTAYLQSASQMASQMGNDKPNQVIAYMEAMKLANAFNTTNVESLDTLVKTLNTFRDLIPMFGKDKRVMHDLTGAMKVVLSKIMQHSGGGNQQEYSTKGQGW